MIKNANLAVCNRRMVLDVSEFLLIYVNAIDNGIVMVLVHIGDELQPWNAILMLLQMGSLC